MPAKQNKKNTPAFTCGSDHDGIPAGTPQVCVFITRREKRPPEENAATQFGRSRPWRTFKDARAQSEWN